MDCCVISNGLASLAKKDRLSSPIRTEFGVLEICIQVLVDDLFDEILTGRFGLDFENLTTDVGVSESRDRLNYDRQGSVQFGIKLDQALELFGGISLRHDVAAIHDTPRPPGKLIVIAPRKSGASRSRAGKGKTGNLCLASWGPGLGKPECGGNAQRAALAVPGYRDNSIRLDSVQERE